MDQVISFDKSLQQRLQEYKDVLSGYEVLPVSALSREWSFYLELTLDPNGWQAVWKIPRVTCESLNIPFPSVVLVFVLNVNFKNLLAFVRVLAVQDDIHIPEKHYVPLMQLWPTKDQDKSIALNLQSTANVLDMLRFFYTHVFMPWDIDDEDTSDWKNKHLESRLRLYYDMKNGLIPRSAAEHVRALLTEARRLQTKRELIESELSDSELDLECGQANNSPVETLMQLHVRILEIRSEIEIVENPLLRNVLIQRHSEVAPKRASNDQQVWLIFDEGKVDDHINFLQKVKVHFPDNKVTFASNLASTLEIANPDDIFILNESTHSIRTTGSLETGGVIKGIGQRNMTLLTSKIDDVMLDFMADNVLLENITIDASPSQCAILIRRGKVVLSNCKIIGDGISSTHQGIIVLGGGCVEIIDCEITGFCTAIVGNSGSSITLKNTEIHDVNFGLKIYDNCLVAAQKSTFHDCRDYGICIETENNLGDKKTGDFETLSIIPGVKTEFVSGRNNAKGDVIINLKSRIKPFEDLFENPDLDPTIIEDPPEENMETTDDVASTESDMNEKVRQNNISPATV